MFQRILNQKNSLQCFEKLSRLQEYAIKNKIFILKIQGDLVS